jgi:hypothetical protein
MERIVLATTFREQKQHAAEILETALAKICVACNKFTKRWHYSLQHKDGWGKPQPICLDCAYTGEIPVAYANRKEAFVSFTRRVVSERMSSRERYQWKERGRSRTFRASYPGPCSDCGGLIRVGELICYDSGGVYHDNCLGNKPFVAKNGPVVSRQGGRYPIDRPCSACSAGDYEMKYHLHYPPFRKGYGPDCGAQEELVEPDITARVKRKFRLVQK